MFCPKCGLERQSAATSFCSRCGFLLTGTADLIELGGLLPSYATSPDPSLPSPRGRGVRQGLFIFLLSFLIVPLLALITVVLNMRSPVLPVLALLLLGVGGALRMVYAWLFEASSSAVSASGPHAHANLEFPAQPRASALPDGTRSQTASEYAAPSTGRWRETNDLEPHSVTEGTTRLLESDERN